MMVFGVDRLFAALQCAKKKSCRDNPDYVVADSGLTVFGRLRFDLVLALNGLEVVRTNRIFRSHIKADHRRPSHNR